VQVGVFLYNSSINFPLEVHLANMEGGERSMQALSAESGQSLVEYALILVFVAMIVMLLMLVFGPATANIYSNIISSM